MSTESSGPDFNSTELAELTNQTLGPVQAKVNQFNLKAAGAAFNFVKRNLGTFTEPFFRIGMGERYYSRETHGAGFMFWLFCAGACMAPSKFVSGLGFAIVQFQLRPLYFVFHGNFLPICTALSSLLMAWLQFRLGGLNFNLIKKYRDTGEPYHTRSRGVLRWGVSGYFVAVPIVSFLFIFNLPAAAMFIIGFAVNSKLKSEQQSAIMSRYHDAMDADIEKKFLEGAALGEFPAKLSYLYEPLDIDMNPLVRQQVAAALVGKPVLGVARPPREKNGSQQPDTDNPPTSPTKTGFQSDWAERESEFRAETLPDAKMNPEPTMDSQEISAAEATRSNINKIFTATDMSQEKFDKAIKLGFVFRRLFIAGILIAVILIVGVKLFHRARPYSKPQVAASVSAPQSQNNAAPTPSVTPVLNQVQPAASAGSSVETANLAAAPSQVQDNPKSDQTMETIRSIVVAENQKISEFRTNCDEIISAHSKNIQNTSISVRQALMDQLLRVQHRAGMVLTNQISFMDYQQQLLQNITQHHLPIEQDALDKLNAAAPKMENERRNVFVLLNKINDEIVSARQ